MPTLPERLREKWVGMGVPVRPGVTLEEIREFESRYGVRLPADLRDYFMTVDGMQRWHSDEDMMEFLHLGAVKSVSQELADFRGIPDYGNIVNTLPQPERHFVIIDFMITSHVYAVRLYDGPAYDNPILGISGDRFWWVANSFTEFAEKYIQQGWKALL